MNRHHQARRSASGISSKYDPGHPAAAHREVVSVQSPQLQPTPPSQTSSPSTTKSPGFVGQGGMTSPPSDLQAQQQLQLQQQQPRRQQQLKVNCHPRIQPHPGIRMPSTDQSAAQLTPQTAGPTGSGSARTTTYYPSPFQNHTDQLGKLTRPLLSIFL